jgi:type IV pilus assembly protein PilM
VSGNAVIVKKISLPQMSAEELGESIHWEAEQYIPFDIQDVSLDYEILEGSGDGGNMDVLLVAVKKDKISDYTSVSPAARPPGSSTSMSSLSRTVTRSTTASTPTGSWRS